MVQLIKMSNMFIELARKAINIHIATGETIQPPQSLPEKMKTQAGVFVSLHKHGTLRGCIGTFMPTTKNIATEIIEMAIASSTSDPRFPPVVKSELDTLEISIDVLSPPENIDSTNSLNPKVYGVIVRSGFKRGLLLPDLEGINTPEEQVDIAKRKAGIYGDEPIKLQRFKVTRHLDTDSNSTKSGDGA